MRWLRSWGRSVFFKRSGDLELLGEFVYVMRTRRIRSSSNSMPSKKHQTVLLHEAIDWLAIKDTHTVVDATLGSAGHARMIAERLGPKGVLIGLDADSEAVENAREKLKDVSPRVILVHANFRDLPEVLKKEGISEMDSVLFDLGWRTEQLEGRGLSFLHDEPLLMTFNKNPPEGALTARDILNTWSEVQIADLIYTWGEEHFSRHIAHAIVERRKERAVIRTHDLRDIVWYAVPVWYRKRRIHPATKTFQALRIAVNDEMHALAEALKNAQDLLAKNGRIAVISFHSIEDGLVKRAFKGFEAGEQGIVLTPKPIAPSREEIADNHRARSAKLRVYEKI